MFSGLRSDLAVCDAVFLEDVCSQVEACKLQQQLHVDGLTRII